MKSSSLSADDVRHLAKLSSLTLSEVEIETFRKQFDETLDFIKNLEELDTAGVDSATHLSGQNNVYFEDGELNDRQLSQQNAVKNSAKHQNGYFVVDRIL